jgi:hypothetical protein
MILGHGSKEELLKKELPESPYLAISEQDLLDVIDRMTFNEAGWAIQICSGQSPMRK